MYEGWRLRNGKMWQARCCSISTGTGLVNSDVKCMVNPYEEELYKKAVEVYSLRIQT